MGYRRNGLHFGFTDLHRGRDDSNAGEGDDPPRGEAIFQLIRVRSRLVWLPRLTRFVVDAPVQVRLAAFSLSSSPFPKNVHVIPAGTAELLEKRVTDDGAQCNPSNIPNRLDFFHKMVFQGLRK
jgi:hypothetical protein